MSRTFAADTTGSAARIAIRRWRGERLRIVALELLERFDIERVQPRCLGLETQVVHIELREQPLVVLREWRKLVLMAVHIG